MNLNELYTQIITENSRSKENRHPVRGGDPQPGGRQPQLRRRHHPAAPGEGRQNRGRRLYRQRLRHLPGIGFADDRPGQGPHRRGCPPPHQPLLPDDQGQDHRPRNWTTWRTWPPCRASPTSPPASSAPCWPGTPWRKPWTARERPRKSPPRMPSKFL